MSKTNLEPFRFCKIGLQNTLFTFWQKNCHLLILFCLVLSFFVLFCLVLSFFVLFCLVLSCLVLFCLVLPCFVLFCLVLSCFVLFCLVLSCFVLFCLVLSCFVLSCLVLSCFVLFCLVLSCFVLFCLVLWYVLIFCTLTGLTYNELLDGRSVLDKLFLKMKHKKCFISWCLSKIFLIILCSYAFILIFINKHCSFSIRMAIFGNITLRNEDHTTETDVFLNYIWGVLILVTLIISTLLNPVVFIFNYNKPRSAASLLYIMLSASDFLTTLLRPIILSYELFKPGLDDYKSDCTTTKIFRQYYNTFFWEVSATTTACLAIMRFIAIQFPFYRPRKKIMVGAIVTWTLICVTPLIIYTLLACNDQGYNGVQAVWNRPAQHIFLLWKMEVQPTLSRYL